MASQSRARLTYPSATATGSLGSRNESSDEPVLSIPRLHLSLLYYSQNVRLSLFPETSCSCCVAALGGVHLQTAHIQRTVEISSFDRSQPLVADTTGHADPRPRHCRPYHTNAPYFAHSPKPTSAFLLRPRFLFESAIRSYSPRISPRVHH